MNNNKRFRNIFPDPYPNMPDKIYYYMIGDVRYIKSC